MEHVEKILQLDPNKKAAWSSIYKVIQKMCPASWANTKTKWEEDLQIDILDNTWEKCLVL